MIGVGVAGLLGFTLLARRVDAHETRALDSRARRQFPKRRRCLTRVTAHASGHALQTSAVAWTTAYVLLRERLAPRAGVIPVAMALPIASGLAKLYLDKHWFTDVMGGYLLGAALAASAAAGYEIAGRR